MAEQEDPAVEPQACGDDEDDNDNPDYRAPAPKSLDEILQQDQEDESLKKYKEQLLAGAGTGEKIIIGKSTSLVFQFLKFESLCYIEIESFCRIYIYT